MDEQGSIPQFWSRFLYLRHPKQLISVGEFYRNFRSFLCEQ